MIEILYTTRNFRCPVCQELVELFALVIDGEPGKPEHLFWGEKGTRRLFHKIEGAWCHFTDGKTAKLVYLSDRASLTGYSP